jgi:predicted Zn-dependent protease
MSRSTDLVEQVLAIVRDRCEAEVVAKTGMSELTRFANSFIHQNVSDEVEDVSVRVAVSGRVASATTTNVTQEGLASMISAAIETAELQRVDEDFPGFGSPEAPIEHDRFDEATEAAEPGARAEIVKDFVDAGEGLSAAGMCETNSWYVGYGNTNGRFADGRYTTAALDGIHQTSTTAGSGHSSGIGIGAIDGRAAGTLAAERARAGLEAFDAKPDVYEVILAPECMSTIAEFLRDDGFSGRSATDGTSFVSIGEQRFDPSVNLVDDAFDQRALGLAFDAEGTTRKRLALIDAGVTPHLLHDRRTAAHFSVEPNGHASFAGEAWVGGPTARNLFFGEGAATEDELIANVERGIYVSTFNYCRVLDKKSMVVTGLTRNGTFMIENGVITGALTNLRFTQSFLDALAPGNVAGIGSNGRFTNGDEHAAVVHAPSFHLASWNFTGGADG